MPIISKVRIEPIIVRLHHITIYPKAIGIYSEKINDSHFSEIYIFFPSACNTDFGKSEHVSCLRVKFTVFCCNDGRVEFAGGWQPKPLPTSSTHDLGNAIFHSHSRKLETKLFRAIPVFKISEWTKIHSCSLGWWVGRRPHHSLIVPVLHQTLPSSSSSSSSPSSPLFWWPPPLSSSSHNSTAKSRSFEKSPTTMPHIVETTLRKGETQ